MASHDNYDKDVLKALQRIADVLKALQRIANSLEKIEKKMPGDCSTRKYRDIHLGENPWYSCRDGSNYVSR